MSVDALDAKLILLLTEDPGIPVIECARRLQIARATAQSRLDKLKKSGIIASQAPTLDPTALGYPVHTFCTIQVRQVTSHTEIAENLSRIPEILDLYTTTGDYDMIATVVSRTTSDLQRVLDLISNTPGILRVSTRIALATHFTNRTLPLLHSSLNWPSD